MKNFTLLLASAVLFVNISFAQIVNIPDANFKAVLLAHSPIIDANGDTEIQVSEANAFTGTLDIVYNGIASLEGLQAFTSIDTLICFNHVDTLDLSLNTGLEAFNCPSCQLEFLNVTQNANLTYLNLPNSYLFSIDVSQNTMLEYLDVSDNYLPH